MKQKLSRYEKLTIWSSGTSAAIAIITMIFVGGQYHEMHTGGKDTHDLAESTNRQAIDTHDLAQHANDQAQRMKDFADQMKLQADRTRDLADQMKAQAGSTEKIAEEAKLQALAARISADAATEAVSVSQKTLEISQRPWISVRAEITGAMRWDFNGATMPVRFSLTNVGHTPATQVFLLVQGVVLANPIDSPVPEENQLCQYVEMHGPKLGKIIYPGDYLIQDSAIRLSRTDLEKAKGYFGGKQFAFDVIGCTAYHDTLSKEARIVADTYQVGIKQSKEVPYGMSGAILALPIDQEINRDVLVLLPKLDQPTFVN